MKRQSTRGDGDDRLAKRQRTTDEIQQDLGMYIIGLPVEVLSVVGLSIESLATASLVSGAWRRAVTLLFISGTNGEEVRRALGMSLDEVVAAINDDTFYTMLGTLAKFNVDFTNPLTNEPVAIVGTVLRYVREGHIKGPDRWEQAYDLVLRLTRIATMHAVERVLNEQFTASGDYIEIDEIIDVATNTTYPLGGSSPAPNMDIVVSNSYDTSTHPVFRLLGRNAHSIRVAADKPNPVQSIELVFHCRFMTLPDDIELRLGVADESSVHRVRRGEDQEITLGLRESDGSMTPIVRLRVHGMDAATTGDGMPMLKGRMSIIYVNIDAVLRGTRFAPVDSFAEYVTNPHVRHSHPPDDLLSNRRLIIGMPETLVAAYDFLTLGLKSRRGMRLNLRLVTLSGGTGAKEIWVPIGWYVRSVNVTGAIYLCSEDIAMIFDTYNIWSAFVDYRVPGDIHYNWIQFTEDGFPHPRRNRETGTLRRIFWRSPLIQCATCPSADVTHVATTNQGHAGQCAACAGSH